MHRDLKPKNVFLDFSGDIKIGDLGLARFSSGHRKGEGEEGEEGIKDKDSKATTLESEELSAQVGTYLYLAPEVLHGGGDQDDQSKRDLYALGIVLFEMWSHFETLMERIVTLQEVRKGQFPSKFEETQKKSGRGNVMQLILWLLQPTPSQRPTALQVLDSELLPRTMLESELKQLLSNIQSQPYFHAMLMEALFGRQDRAADLLYDPSSCLVRLAGPALACVTATLTRVFIRHAARLLEVPLMTPKSSLLAHKQHVLLMDATGTQFCLPYDSSTPFAYYVAREIVGKTHLPGIRRYSFGRVYRSRMGGLPKEASEASFDIMSSQHASAEQRCIEEAEVLRVLLEALHACPLESSDSYIVSVSYKGLMCGMLQAKDVPPSRMEDVYMALIHTRKLGRTAGRKKLAHVLGEEDQAMPKSLTSLLNKLWEAQDKGCLAQVKVLQDALMSSAEGSEAVRQLRQVLEFVCAMLPHQSDRIRITVDPTLSLPLYKDGLVVHAGIRTEKKRSERVVATGGRYDSLVLSQELRPVGTKPAAASCGVVGICFSLDRLCTDTRMPVSANLQGGGLHAPGAGGAGGDGGVTPACSVLVYSRDGVKADERLAVMGELWDNGIGARTPDVSQTLTTEQLHSMCAQKLLDWILVLERPAKASSGGGGSGGGVGGGVNSSSGGGGGGGGAGGLFGDLRMKLMRSRDAVKAERVKAERLRVSGGGAVSRKKDSYDNILDYIADIGEYQPLAEYQPLSVAELLKILLDPSAASTAQQNPAQILKKVLCVVTLYSNILGH